MTVAKVDTGLWATGLGLAPGQEHSWIQADQNYGQVRWFVAHPLALPGTERRLEVTHVGEWVSASGVRTINVVVRNVGSTTANYGIFVAQTV
ncbi:hypothetical protein ACH4SP_04800 [Streptomyces sp. NPDC021093]|uniref:hypothetical protein n=1 Tax=Streptomyces sp. NPDC021093 TaxID=3365112 RepID=UPI00378E7CCC